MKKILLFLSAILIVISMTSCDRLMDALGNQSGDGNSSTGNGGAQTHETHNFGEWSLTKNPTCIEKGEKVRYCSCGEKQTEVVAEIAHTPSPAVVENQVNATCIADGRYDEVVYCSVEGCKTQISRSTNTVSALGHIEVTDSAVAATCTEPGLTAGKHCSACNEVIIAQTVIDALGHRHSDTYTSDANYHWYACTVCGAECDKVYHTVGEDSLCTACGTLAPTPGIVYSLSSDGSYAMVVGYDGTSTKVRIADEYNGVPVTEISESAFIYKSITDVVIPDSVTSIGSSAFRSCDTLKSVIIGDGVTSIGNQAFYNCDDLTSVTIPDSVTSIGDGAFRDCANLTSVTIPDSVTSIGAYAFSNCYSLYTEYKYGKYVGDADNPYTVLVELTNKNLSTYEIHEGAKHIAGGVFDSCSSLTSITIPDGVKSIGDNAFYDCDSLASITIPDSVTSIGNYAFAYCSVLTSVTIHNGVTSIGNSAFRKCSSLTTVTIGNSVTSIGNQAFLECSNLTSIVIPDGVTSIGVEAFSCCSSLTNITIPDSVTSIGKYAFYYCFKLASVYISDIEKWCEISFDSLSNPLTYAKNLYLNGALVTDLIIPDGVTSIGNYAFYSCTSLTSISIPDSVTSIGDCAFAYCSGLTSITIPDNVTSIGEGVFGYCSSLTSITIPDVVTNIGNQAFYNCSSLTSITIPDNVTSIGEDAFSGCTSLTSVHITDITKWCEISFGGTFSNPLSYAKKLYLNGALVTDLVIPDSVTSIGNWAFAYCYSLTSVTIPKSVISVGDYALYNCASLTTVTIGDSVTSIGSYAFDGCSGLKSITIPDSVKSIGNYAFRGCASLTSVTIGDGVTSIGNYAFRDCTSLTSVTIPDSVKSIGYGAFENCTSLTSITIPDSVTSIGENAFYNCNSDLYTEYKYGKYVGDAENRYAVLVDLTNDSLSTYEIHEDTKHIEDMVFGGCSSLTSITIPDGVKSIGDDAFNTCTNLTSVTIGDDVTSIGDRAFNYCLSLTSITIPDGVKSIGYCAFNYCLKLTDVYYTGTEEQWGNIEIGEENSSLTSATKHYNHVIPEE